MLAPRESRAGGTCLWPRIGSSSRFTSTADAASRTCSRIEMDVLDPRFTGRQLVRHNRLVIDPTEDDWSELEASPPPKSLKKSCSAAEHPTRKELSAISDAQTHGIQPPGPSHDQASVLSGLPFDNHVCQPAVDGIAWGRVHLPLINAPSPPPHQSSPVQHSVGQKKPVRHSPSFHGLRPSNRSEAARLGSELSRQLAATPQRNFRAEKRVYDAVFKSVTDQVAVHCSERGMLLERLRAFYTQSTDVTARVAENGVRSEADRRVNELERKVSDGYAARYV